MADKDKRGRPPKYKTPAELQEKIDEYFNGGYALRAIVSNGVEFKVPAITITGLAYFLGFESRRSFYDYEAKDEFSYTIKRARLRIEIHYEEGLQTSAPTGSIFALKNMGWEDSQKITHDALPDNDLLRRARRRAEEIVLGGMED